MVAKPVNQLSEPQAAVIASGASVSGDLNLGGRILVGIAMPAAWTAASITFEVSPDRGTTWLDMYDITETEMAISPVVDNYYAIDPLQFLGVNHLRIRSGTAATPVNQGAERTVTLMLGEPAKGGS